MNGDFLKQSDSNHPNVVSTESTNHEQVMSGESGDVVVEDHVRQVHKSEHTPGKDDIRFYGSKKAGQIFQSKRDRKSLNDQIEKLRKSKAGEILPNLADRVKAGYLLDEVNGKEPIKVPKSRSTNGKPLQKAGPENVCFAGADVVSLFPSLKAVEVARLARYAVMRSDV